MNQKSKGSGLTSKVMAVPSVHAWSLTLVFRLQTLDSNK